MNNARSEPQGGEMALTEWKKKEENSALHKMFLYLIHCLNKC